jgi:methyl-accepting chemotaxis protein
MTIASTGLARNMGSVSSVVEENAAAAGQMRSTAGSIAQTVAPITVTAREQSAAAVEASVATNQLAAGIEEMSATANALLEHAQGLRRVVSEFRVRATAALPAKEAPALTA